MNTNLEKQTIALAAMCQVATCLYEIATGNTPNDQEIVPLLQSLLITDPESVQDVYPHIAYLDTGLQVVIKQLEGQGTKENPRILRYVVNMMTLDARLMKRKDLLAILSERIAEMKRQSEHHALISAYMLENIASIYSDLISPIGPQLRMLDYPEIAAQPPVQHKIKALVLSGIRACVLWRQVGGRRLQVALSRGKIAACARKMRRLQHME